VVNTETAEGTDPAKRRSADRLLVRVGRSGGAWVAGLAASALALAIAETLLPAVLGRTVDSALDGAVSLVTLGAFAALVAVLVACDAFEDLAAGAVTARSTAWLRHSVLRHVLLLGPRTTASAFSPGDVAARIVANAAESGRVAPDVVRAAANLLPAVGAVVALALIDPWLCLTFVAGLPVLVLLVRAFARQASDIATQYLEAQGTIAARLVDALAGARTIAAAGTLEREAKRVLGPLPELRSSGTAMWRTQMRIVVQDTLLVSLLEIAVIAVAGLELARGRITPGEMLAASQYALLGTTLASAVPFFVRLARTRAAAARVAELTDRPLPSNGTEGLPAGGGGRLELRGVTARAGDRTVLDGIDLTVPAGALVAVVGASGSGKSLLAALVGRLDDPEAGQILLDGTPIDRVARSALRRAIGYGFERPVLIGETIGDAIAFGDSAPSADEVAAAARAAQADGFVRRMPQGYETPLRDAPMSAGEVQRVGLARTFAHAGRVIVLDDVAASLDTVTEHYVSEILAGELADRTRIVVAHRTSTAARADSVVWLDKGAVRAFAPHEHLWRDPDYRALFAPEAS